MTSELKKPGASMLARLFAQVIDCIFLLVIFFVLVKFLSTTIQNENSIFSIHAKFEWDENQYSYGLYGLWAVLYFAVVFFYFAILEWLAGATLGKLFTNIKVIKSTGVPLDFKGSMIRNLFRLIDFLPVLYIVGAIAIWKSPTKQRLGDQVAGTVVVAKYGS